MKFYGILIAVFSLVPLTLSAVPSSALEELQARYQSILDEEELLKVSIAKTKKELAYEQSIALMYDKNNENEKYKASFEELYVHAWKRLLKKYRTKLKKLSTKEKEVLCTIIEIERRLLSVHKVATTLEVYTKPKRNLLYRTLAHIRLPGTSSDKIRARHKSLPIDHFNEN